MTAETTIRCAWCRKVLNGFGTWRTAQTGEIVCVSPSHCKARAMKGRR